MSVFLNIVSAVLILPLVAFSVFLLFIDAIIGRPLGSLFGAMLDVLILLPNPDNPLNVMIALVSMVLVVGGLIYLMIRFVFLFPLTMLVIGILSLAFVELDTSVPPSPDDLFLWTGALGILASAAQLKRTLYPRARPA